jgi:outer membrane protein OmpA-like peptidoglycan-associated protein
MMMQARILENSVKTIFIIVLFVVLLFQAKVSGAQGYGAESHEDFKGVEASFAARAIAFGGDIGKIDQAKFNHTLEVADGEPESTYASKVARPQRSARYGAVSVDFNSPEGLVLTSAETGGSTASDLVDEGDNATSTLRESWTKTEEVSYLRHLKPLKGAAMAVDALRKDELKSQTLTFVIEDPDGNLLPGQVSLVNFEKSRVIASFRPGEQVSIRGTRREQMLAFVCEELGYGMETRFYNIDHLSRGQGIRKNAQGIWEVTIRLKKMELYDQAILYNTRFYKDDAILLPGSTVELDELVKMMKANPGYKIVVHSHCNKGKRHVIALPSEGNASGQHVSRVTKGSDRMLTRKRAKVIRDYLVENGVSMKRVDVVGWGSSEMLVNPKGEEISLNERVEVELVGDGGE